MSQCLFISRHRYAGSTWNTGDRLIILLLTQFKDSAKNEIVNLKKRKKDKYKYFFTKTLQIRRMQAKECNRKTFKYCI